MMLLIPANLSEISSAWLGHVLDARVTAVRLVDAHDGTTGRGVIELEYDGAPQLPSRLFVKLPPADEMQRAFVCSSGMGRREALFYRQLAAEVPLRVPYCYHAASDDAGEEYIMLLEHLEDSGCTFRNATVRYSSAYIQQVLAAFARLHAAYWESPRFATDLAWVQPPVQHEIAVQLIAQALQQHSQTMPPVFRAMGELYLEHTDAIHQLWNRGDVTLIHGDVHDGNLFFDGEQPGFLDWALVARGPAMRDVGYFLAGTLEPQDQRDWGRDMVAFYREQLLHHGAPAADIRAMWRQYQWHAAYVWVGATVTLAMGDAWQPVAYVKKTLERLHAAMDTLDSVVAIQDALDGN
jgi:aminoglycoside phosphotransferase (APT) family kinase protein